MTINSPPLLPLHPHLSFLDTAWSAFPLSMLPGRRAENSVGMVALDSSSVLNRTGGVPSLPTNLLLRPASSGRVLATNGSACD